LPYFDTWVRHAWHIFAIRHPDREELQKKLKKAGVNTMIHYPIPPHMQSAYAEMGYKKGDFPISENIHNTILSLPISPHLDNDQLKHVIHECLNV
jgi:dTDP-4-amino-4,6-dideoxygalactose transaminase